MIENIEFKVAFIESTSELSMQRYVPMTVTPTRMLFGAVLSFGHG